MIKLIILFIFLSTFAKAAPVAQIIFHSVVKKSNSKDIYVKDIAKITNLKIGLASKIENIKISSYPKLGAKKVILNSNIISKLKSFNHELKRNKVKIVIPKEISVTNNSKLSNKQVSIEIVKVLSKNCDGCKIELSKLILPIINENIKIESWEVKNTKSKPRGHFMLPLKINFKSKSRVYWVKGLVKVFKKVPVMQNPVFLGERIVSQDVALVYRDVTYNPNQEINLQYLIGKKTNRNLRKGQIVRQGFFSLDKALKRGDIISVRLGNSSWSINLKAKAEQDGVLGDRVQVRNLKSNKLMTGLVTGIGEVTLE